MEAYSITQDTKEETPPRPSEDTALLPCTDAPRPSSPTGLVRSEDGLRPSEATELLPSTDTRTIITSERAVGRSEVVELASFESLLKMEIHKVYVIGCGTQVYVIGCGTQVYMIGCGTVTPAG